MKTLGLRTRGWTWACPLHQRTLSYELRRVLSYELRGTMTKPRSSSSASRAVHIPALSKAALQDGIYQPGGAYHTTHEARLDHAGARAAWNITGLWGVSLLNSREKLLAELFPDLNQEYNDWHLTSNDPLQAFREQREDADPDADLKIWQLDDDALDPSDASQPEQLPSCRRSDLFWMTLLRRPSTS
jgi:hypothetical protein